jgi:hypothetical protein
LLERLAVNEEDVGWKPALRANLKDKTLTLCNSYSYNKVKVLFMHYNSERVQQWRRKTKELLVDLLGGRCVICRYNKCVSALEFHHVFADEKKDTLARMLANPQSINKS